MQTRSTAKGRASKKSASEKVRGDLSLEHSQTDHTPRLVKKPRREGTPVPKKQRRGKQREICQLNLDVLFLIAAYIHPVDLLNLARTCKSLRQLLMDKSSAFVWKEARCQATGLPDCPTDLTEPEYANLVFYARCYGCGRYAKTVLWEMRRRYCLDCRIGRLCSLSTCHDIIRRNYVLAREHITVEGETAVWVDREQMEEFMQEYRHSSDEKQFIREKKEQYDAIVKHARLCEKWQRDKSSERKAELEVRRQERGNSIFERLKRLGYEREVAFFTRKEIQLSCKALFGKSKPLTDKEWNTVWPKWIESMDNFRYRRLDKTVYQHRRILLASKYKDYRLCPPPNATAFDLLPSVADLACFPPFRDVITAPEGTTIPLNAFNSAFAQLPDLVDDWKKKLDIEVAALVKIPSDFTTEGASKSTPVSSESKAVSGSTQTITSKLRLACALFHGRGDAILTYPEMLSSSISLQYCAYESGPERDSHNCRSFKERYNIRYIEKAPYVIRACGLDPNLATVDDMDRWDPRLRCQSCLSSRVWRWRDAVLHAYLRHHCSPEWQIVSDKHVANHRLAMNLAPSLYRCLLCLPSVGDAKSYTEIYNHLTHGHNIQTIRKGRHFMPVGLALLGCPH